jgi:mono/diheme cytochrome c family protein
MSSTGPNLLCSTLLLALGTLLFPALAEAAEQEPGTLRRAQGETVARAALPADHAQKMTRGLETFQSKVRELLVEHCLKCHGGEKTKGEFSVATRESLLKGGEEGVAVVAFQAKASRLLRLIQHAEEPHMPDKGPKLGLDAIALIASWIDDGAPYDRPLVEGQVPTRERGAVTAADREWWSFRPLSKPAPPPAPNPPAGAQDGGRDGNGNSIDRFIVAKAATQHLALAPRAERHVLIRRAYLDLLGLPPPPEAVAAFVSDPSPEAWPRLIDTLLASPRYGERWARHWLDLARFAESSGFEHDYDREGAFHYRDFVIKALNMDLPFEQFVRWQVAGDEFEPENPLALAATGFLGAGVFPTQITANEVERTRYDALDDMLSTTGSTFLGLSIGCARCHDHKYDPIPALDYYRMLSTFTTTTRSVVDLDVEPEKTRQQIRRWETEHAPLQSELNRYEESLPGRCSSSPTSPRGPGPNSKSSTMAPTWPKGKTAMKMFTRSFRRPFPRGSPGCVWMRCPLHH